MKPYIVIVHKDQNSAYGMSFPDAPGCFSAADEIDDLFAMAAEALELWAEGMREDGDPLPPPRDLSEIKADPKWCDNFEDAALVIALAPPVLNLSNRRLN
jgi:predicted RNase H-like HicB family nuclease